MQVNVTRNAHVVKEVKPSVYDNGVEDGDLVVFHDLCDGDGHP